MQCAGISISSFDISTNVDCTDSVTAEPSLMTGASYDAPINYIVIQNADPSLTDTSFNYFYCMEVSDAYSNVLALNAITINFNGGSSSASCDTTAFLTPSWPASPSVVPY